MSLEDFLKWMEFREATLTVSSEPGHAREPGHAMLLRLKCPCGDSFVTGERMVSKFDLSISVVPIRSIRLKEMILDMDKLILEQAWPTK